MIASYFTDISQDIKQTLVKTVIVRVGTHEITSQPFLRYLGVTIDAKLNCKEHLEHVSTKVSIIRMTRGPKQRRMALLSSVGTSQYALLP